MDYWKTPIIKPKQWVPEVPEVIPVKPRQESHFERFMTWLLHKPQNHAIFPVEPQSGKNGISTHRK